MAWLGPTSERSTSTASISGESRNGKSEGFTLVELLVVIAIIAILAVLLLPSFAAAKASAKSAACKSNLHQIGLALVSYTHDYDYYPPHDPLKINPSLIGIYAWPAHLLPYLSSNTSIFRCAAAPVEYEWNRDLAVPTGFVFPYNVGAYTPFSYGYNISGVAALGPWLGLGGTETSETPASWIVKPSEMIAMGDSNDDKVADGEIGFFRPGGLPLPLNPPGNRHKRGANILFCDDHVEWASQSKLLARTPEAACRWNNDNRPHPEAWTSK